MPSGSTLSVTPIMVSTLFDYLDLEVGDGSVKVGFGGWSGDFC